jgi:hypothetical protein
VAAHVEHGRESRADRHFTRGVRLRFPGWEHEVAPDDVEAKDPLVIVERRLELFRAEHAYSAHVEIRDLGKGRGTRRTGPSAEGIFGEIKNLGGHTVTKLVLRFELLDAGGKPVGEKEWTPVFERDSERPLKPNFTRPFGFAVEQPPSDWVGIRGAVKVVRLSREGAEFPGAR